MPITTLAKISFSLDIPQVDVLATKQTRDGQFIITVESRGETTKLYNPTTTQTLDWYEQRSPHTKAYDRYLMKLLMGSTVADVSLKENLGYDAVLGALERQVDDEVNWDETQNLDTIGIDEVAHKKGRKGYRTVITARQDDGTILILAVLPIRKKSSERFSHDDSQTATDDHPHLNARRQHGTLEEQYAVRG